MYRIEAITGVIVCEDNYRVAPPYDDPRYLDYAAWVSSGNSPEVITEITISPDTVVTNFQAKAALVQLGLYSVVEAYMLSPDTDPMARLRWQHLDFRRGDPDVVNIGTLLGLDLDHLFTVAKAIYDPKAPV